MHPHPDGRDRIFEVSATFLPLDDSDRATGSLAMFSDVTDARFAASKLRHRALHDALTGLPNRALFDDRLLMALSRHAQGTGHPNVAVLSIDLDGFKLINEVHGHEAGDAILVEVAHRLHVASAAASTIARAGSDEFVIIAEGVDVESAVGLAEQLRRALLEPIVVDAAVVYVDASIGIALAPQHGTARLLRSAADLALSQAKALGGARVHVFNPSREHDAARKLELAAGLREALANDTLALGYQPTVDLDTGCVVGVEALLRWNHQELRRVGPIPRGALSEKGDGLFPRHNMMEPDELSSGSHAFCVRGRGADRRARPADRGPGTLAAARPSQVRAGGRTPGRTPGRRGSRRRPAERSRS